MLAVFLVSTAVTLAAFALDFLISVKGIRSGVALESNWLVRKFYGAKPSAEQLFIALFPQDLVLIAGAFALARFTQYGGIIGAGILGGTIARHIQNYFAWKKLGA